MKATKSTVNVGHIQLDGYLMEDGRFGMSLSDICRVVGWDAQRGSHILKNKWVKTLSQSGFKGSQKVSLPEKNHAVLIDIEWIPAVFQGLARSGNEMAWDFLNLLAGASLQKLFCDAFGRKFEAEEMQAWLLERTQGIEKRNAWTDAIASYMNNNEVSDNYRHWIYSNVSNALNKALTGRSAKSWCDEIGCLPGKLRDEWTDSHLANINSIEKHATVLVGRGMEPMQAQEEAVAFFAFPICENPRKTLSKDAAYKRAQRARDKAKGEDLV